MGFELKLSAHVILGIESSCDDTAAAIVSYEKGNSKILSSVVVNQNTLHEKYGGVVPEIAARAHAERVDTVVKEALAGAKLSLLDINLIGVTAGPGLIGGVVAGVMCAKGLAYGANLPLVGVNHLAGHALTPRLTGNLEYPYLILIASGGHCQFVIVESANKFSRLGGTIDDAPGEAFDKTARLLGLEQPGGPSIEREAINGDFKRFTPRDFDHEYSIDHFEDKFYIITNWKAKNNRLMQTPDSKTDIANWEEVLPHREKAHLLSLEIFKNYLVINERKDGLRQIRIIEQRTQKDEYLNFDEEAYTSWISTNEEFDTNVLRFSFSSLVTPISTFDYNMKTKERTLLKQNEVVGGYDSEKYTSKRMYANARDGKTIPISIVYRKDMKKEEAQNLLLYGYGAYGSTRDPFFSSSRLSLLDRGFIYAIAHVRGGQVYGRQSYDDGKMLNKKNTFYDFIDAGKYLIDQKVTNRNKLFAEGGSAGGLLIGAVVNMEPSLWKGAIAAVPFVDAVTTMADPTIPLTSGEWKEWGDPRIKKYYDYRT